MAKTNHQLALGLLLLRIPIGLYMLLAGVGKVQGELNNGMGSFYNSSFKAMQPDWMPAALGAPYGYALPWLEVLVGIFLIIGLYTRLTGLVGFGMLVSFTIALAMKFGTIAAQPDGPGGPFNANYIQAMGYLLFALVGAGAWSVDVAFLGKRKSKG